MVKRQRDIEISTHANRRKDVNVCFSTPFPKSAPWSGSSFGLLTVPLPRLRNISLSAPLRLLLRQLDQRDRWRETPLHKAARSGNSDIVKALCVARMKVCSALISLLRCSFPFGVRGSYCRPALRGAFGVHSLPLLKHFCVAIVTAWTECHAMNSRHARGQNPPVVNGKPALSGRCLGSSVNLCRSFSPHRRGAI